MKHASRFQAPYWYLLIGAREIVFPKVGSGVMLPVSVDGQLLAVGLQVLGRGIAFQRVILLNRRICLVGTRVLSVKRLISYVERLRRSGKLYLHII